MSLIHVVFYCVIGIILCELPYLPSSGTLRMGYDIVKGNPKGKLYDPGFTKQIFQFSGFTPTPDHRYLVPEDYVAEVWTYCSYDTDADVIEKTSDYLDTLKTDVSASFKGFGFAFSASVDYQKVEKQTTKESTKMVTTKALCTYFRLSLQYEYRKMNLSQSFVEAVQELSKDVNDSAKYQNFISYFGTHFLDRGIFGSKFFIRSSFDQSAWTKFEKTGLDIKAAASASFKIWAADVSGMSNRTKQMAKTFSETRSSLTEIYQGSLPPKTGNWQDWASESQTSPGIIQYSLISLDVLLTGLNFPSIDEETMLAMQQNLGIELTKYCKTVEGCHSPAGSKPFSCLELKESQGITRDGTYTLYYQGLENYPWKAYCKNMGNSLPPLAYVESHWDQKINNYEISHLETCESKTFDFYVQDWQIPIDEATLDIRDDTYGGCCFVTGFPYNCSKSCLPVFGSSRVKEILYHNVCYTCSHYSNILSLNTTKFAFDDSITRYEQMGNYKFLDALHQVVQFGPEVVKKEDCVTGKELEYGFSRLKYIGEYP